MALAPKKDLPKLSDIPRHHDIVSLRSKLYPDGIEQAAIGLTFVVREEIFLLLEKQTDAIPSDILRQVAHAIQRDTDGKLSYAASHVDSVNWRLTTILEAGLGMKRAVDEPILQPGATTGLLLDVHSQKPAPQQPKIPQ